MYALSRQGDEEPQYEAGNVEPESGGASGPKKESERDDSQERLSEDDILPPPHNESAVTGNKAPAGRAVVARSSKSFARLSDEMEPTAAAKPSATKMEATGCGEPSEEQSLLSLHQSVVAKPETRRL